MDEQKEFDLAAYLSSLDVGPKSGPQREQIEYIDISLLDEDEENFYATEGIEDLAANIATIGLLDPLRIRPNTDAPGRFRVVSGHRRRKALALLKEDDPEKWGTVPCIQEDNAQSPAAQELRLILANKDNRKISPNDLLEQAKRVEKLLYQLQEEQGVEFPGRMRDHVAKAVNASKSKLSRLKVIREKLDKVWQLSFKVEKLNESAAYALAKLPAEWQRVIYYGTKDKTPGVVSGVCSISEVTVDNYSEAFEKIKDIQCSIYHGLCSHRSVMLEKLVRAPYIWDACKGCCLDCDKLARCGSSCFRADDKKRAMNQQRKAELTEEKAAAKAQAEADEDLIAMTYNRARDAREKANVEAKELLLTAGMNPLMDKFYTDHETGKAVITKGTGLAYLNLVPIKAARQLLAVSEKLGCSIDWLLGRDVPGPGEMQNGPNSGPGRNAEENGPDLRPGWERFVPAPEAWGDGAMEDPLAAGDYVVLAKWSEHGKMKPHIFAWDGQKWLYSNLDAAAAGAIVCYWMPMPEE